MLEKKIETGVIEIFYDGTLQVREDTVIYENGVEISRTYTRSSYNPGDDLGDKPQLVKDISALVWTPEIIQAYKDKLANGNPFKVS